MEDKKISKKIEEQILDFTRKNCLFDDCGGVVLAVSGGADSMALLCFFLKYKRLLKLPFVVAHVNHGLRKESDSEEKFVFDFCEKNGVKIEILHADIAGTKPNGLSTEEYARNVRYEYFNAVREKYSYSHIATAHNADDNTETFFMNILRGSGVNGACGIKPLREDLVARPLLCCKKEELYGYCKENGVGYVSDSSNFENIYTRNKLRNVIIPQLRQLNPELDGAVMRFMDMFSADEAHLSAEADVIFERIFDKDKKNELPLSELRSIDKALLSRVVRRFYLENFTKSDLTYKQTNDIMHIIYYGAASDKVQLEGDIFAVRTYDSIRFDTPNAAENTFSAPLSVGVNGFSAMTVIISEELCEKTDKNRVIKCENLVVRSRKEGDKIKLYRRPEKTLKKLFSDDKIPAGARNAVAVIESGGKVVYVEGYGADENFLAKPGEACYLIEIIKK